MARGLVTGNYAAGHTLALSGEADRFVEFRKEDIEQSVPARFERQVGRFPGRIAVKTKQSTLK
jgi:hypothetical protein